MDFTEIEQIEALRFPWNAFPPTRSDANDLTIPLSALYTPLQTLPDIPLLNYDPLLCNICKSALNPYARVHYPTSSWFCPFCSYKNFFPKSYAGIGDHNLPAELFPTYSTVEYAFNASSHSTGAEIGVVFCVDMSMEEEELGVVKREVSRVLAGFPEGVLVGLVTFGGMVEVHDLGWTDCHRVLLIAGDRDLSSDKVNFFP